MSSGESTPASLEDLQRRIEWASRCLDSARPAAALPVWVRAALLGAGLALAAGCDRGADAPPAPTERPAVVPGAMEPAPTPPLPPPSADPPGVGDPDAERTGMLPEGHGVYGAPPDGEEELPPAMVMIPPPPAVEYGAPRVRPPGTGPLRLKSTPELPPDAPPELRELALGFLRQVRFCLVSGDRTTPLADGGLELRLTFSEGRLRSVQATGSAAGDATVKRCLAEANRRTTGADPATFSPAARAYRTPMDLKLVWTR